MLYSHSGTLAGLLQLTGRKVECDVDRAVHETDFDTVVSTAEGQSVASAMAFAAKHRQNLGLPIDGGQP